MIRFKKKHKQKKLKTRYVFISDEVTILGASVDICDTVRKLWTYYKCKSQRIYIAIDSSVKTYELREKCISLEDINNIKTYKYLNKIITRDDFILLLNCDNASKK